MQRGRLPKPPKLRLLEGNPGKRKLLKKNPAKNSSKFNLRELPISKRLNKVGKAEWNRVVKFLKENDKLYQADRAAIEMMCLNYQLAMWAWGELSKLGSMVFKPSDRYVQKLPHVDIFQKASKDYKDYAIQFGITPAARERMNFLDKDVDSLMETLID